MLIWVHCFGSVIAYHDAKHIVEPRYLLHKSQKQGEKRLALATLPIGAITSQ